MGTYAVTGSASGIGAATGEPLRARGHRVVGIDRVGADVTADLGTASGRADGVGEVTDLLDGALDGAVCCAGVPGTPGRDGAELVSVNYFGTVDLLTGLRPLPAEAGTAAAVCLSSNSLSCQPGWPVEVAEACLGGDEAAAR